MRAQKANFSFQRMLVCRRPTVGVMLHYISHNTCNYLQETNDREKTTSNQCVQSAEN